MLNLPPRILLEHYVAFCKTVNKTLDNKIPVSFKCICPENIAFTNDQGFKFDGHFENNSFLDPVLRKNLPDIRDISADKHFIYSLGATFYYYLKGVTVDPKNADYTEIEDNLAKTLKQSLEKDPFNRQNTLTDFIAQLEEVLAKYQAQEYQEIKDKLEYTKVVSKSRVIQIASVCSVTLICLGVATICLLTNFKTSAWSQNGSQNGSQNQQSTSVKTSAQNTSGKQNISDEDAKSTEITEDNKTAEENPELLETPDTPDVNFDTPSNEQTQTSPNSPEEANTKETKGQNTQDTKVTPAPNPTPSTTTTKPKESSTANHQTKSNQTQQKKVTTNSKKPAPKKGSNSAEIDLD